MIPCLPNDALKNDALPTGVSNKRGVSKIGIVILAVSLPVLSPHWLLAQEHRQDGAEEPAASESDAGIESLWTRDGWDWPSFLGPDRDGKSAEKDIAWGWSTQAPQLVWSQRIGEGYAMGSVAAGRYFHFDRDQGQGRLRVFHAETGKLLWQFQYPTDYTDMYGFDGGPRASPVVDRDRVYLLGAEGWLHCLQAADGQKIWDVNTTEEFGVVQNFFGVGSTPLIYKDLLITMVGGSPPASSKLPAGRLAEVQPNGTGIVAFDKFTGAVRYQTINDLASYASPVVVNLQGRSTGLAFLRSGLFAFDPDSGQAGFEFPWRAKKLESVNASTPVLEESQVLITESYGPGAAFLQVQDGQPKPVWQDQGERDRRLACHWNTPILVDGYAYASTGEKQSTALLRCLRLRDGKVMWEEPGLSRSSLTYVDGQLICLTETGRLFHFRPNPESFEIEGEAEISGLRLLFPCWAAPIVSHGYLYVRGKSQVVCLDIRSRR